MAGLVLSCGVLILNAQRELLLCHATGTPRWDIPKGVGEAGETPSQTAVREVREETAIELVGAELLDLGRFAYLRGKDLHLHAALLERLDPKRCACSTFYRDSRGRERPEMDAHAWVGLEAAPARCGKSLAALLTGRLSLPVVLEALLAREQAAGPMHWRWAAG